MKRLTVVSLIAALFTVLAATPVDGADPGDVGIEDFSHAGTGSPLGTKRGESALWSHDGRWWTSLWDSRTADFHLFWLDTARQVWVDSGVTADTRSGTQIDALVDGDQVYLSSHVRSNTPSSGSPTYLYRFRYDAAARLYRLDPGFPARINNYKSKSVVIDKDSTGRLWATWIQSGRVFVNHSSTNDATWGTPYQLPLPNTTVSNEELSSLVAFGGHSIGVMWSNQSTTGTGFYFAVHRDDQPDNVWEPPVLARGGTRSADDHINLKADSAGRVYAAVKTSAKNAGEPLTELLVRNPTSGAWTRHTIGVKSACPNRPIVLVDEARGLVHVLQTGPAGPTYACSNSGGAIYRKTSPLGVIAFPGGHGTLVMHDASHPTLHSVTSTKQLLGAGMGLVALAVSTETDVYWHMSEG